MISFNQNTKTIISIGTGGVGKTTLSAAFAVGLAAQGKKILVLTIDPSQRLAQALGIKSDGEIYQVQHSAIQAHGGQLFATTLNHQKVFKEFIFKAAGQSMIASDVEKLLQNKLYQQLSTQLSGSQDFTSLYQLNQYVNSGEYDIVILDTPPAQHTWGFLTAPEKLARLFNEGVSQWFRDADQKNVGLFKKILNVGTQQVLRALESLTGSEFIKELALFFIAVQKWQSPLEKQVWDCHRLLISKKTEFVLVTALDSSRISEAQKLSQEIAKQGYNLSSIVINRVPTITRYAVSSTTGLVFQYVNYLKTLENQLLHTRSRFGSDLQVYKSLELSNNDVHVQDLKNLFSHIKRFDIQ